MAWATDETLAADIALVGDGRVLHLQGYDLGLDSRRLSILTASEVDDLYGLPRFTEDDRQLYFELSRAERETISSISVRTEDQTRVNGNWTPAHAALLRAAAEETRAEHEQGGEGQRVQVGQAETQRQQREHPDEVIARIPPTFALPGRRRGDAAGDPRIEALEIGSVRGDGHQAAAAGIRGLAHAVRVQERRGRAVGGRHDLRTGGNGVNVYVDSLLAMHPRQALEHGRVDTVRDQHDGTGRPRFAQPATAR